MANLVGQTIGRYQLVELLGEGGMASVYKGYDTRLDRYVAVKVIIQSQQDSTRFLKRFEREAKALAKLSHPNIVKVHDYGEERGLPYLVMEYIPGGTLKEKLGRPIPYQEAARLLLPIAQALDYAHSLDIVHRDVKPANILLTATGIPMLSDFGIAKMLSSGDTTELTGMGVGIGTPEYMAPEQGQGIGVDKRADIYSLGVVLYELVTGRKPFHADTPLAVIVKHMSEPLPTPRQFVPNLPDTVERSLFTSLAKQPGQRYQSMGDFASVLEKIIHTAPTWEEQSTQIRPVVEAETRTRVTPPGYQPEVQPPVFHQPPQYGAQQYAPPQFAAPPQAAGRSMTTWLFAGGFFLLLLILILGGGGIGAYFLFFRSTPTQVAFATPTTAPVDNPTPLPVENTPVVVVIDYSPTPGSAPATETPLTADTPIPPTQTLQPSETSLPTATLIPNTPTNSPIPLLLVYALGDVGNSDVYVADEAGKNQRCIACVESYDEAEPEWSPDGLYVVFQANYYGSYDILAQPTNGGGSLIQITNNPDNDEREPHWSTAGEVVYRVSPKDSNRNAVGDLWVTQINGSSYALGIQGRAPVWSPDGKRIAYMSDQSGTWQIYTYDLGSGKNRQITNASVNCRWHDWSPDGRYLVFNVTTSASTTDPAGIWYVPAEGGDITKLVDGGGAGRPGWSDSGYVAFNTATGIEIIYQDGGSRKVLIKNAKAWAPAWSR